MLVELALLGIARVLDRLDLRSGCELFTASREVFTVAADGTKLPKSLPASTEAFSAAIAAYALSALAMFGIYIFITSWNEYLYAAVLAGQKVRVLTVAVQTLIGEYEIAWGVLTAAGVLGALPVTLLFMIIQRRLIAGMTQGAVKG